MSYCGNEPLQVAEVELPDGDRGEITVSSSGTVWTIDNGVVTPSKLSTGHPTWDGIGNLTVPGTLSSASGTLLSSADIGSSVQAYDADLTSWSAIAPSAKQDTLVNQTNIKSINGTTLLGSGNMTIGGGDVSGPASATDSQLVLFDSTTGKLIKVSTITGLVKATSGVASQATAGTDYLAPSSIGTTVQAFLVSGTNLKTVNGSSLLGSGDVSVSGGGFSAGTRIPFAQASAPTGWTQDTTSAADNRMLRVVNTGTHTTGGSHSPILMDVVPSHTHGFTTGNTDISHSHSATDSGHTHQYTVINSGTGLASGANWQGQTSTTTSGYANITIGSGGGSHSHSGTSNANGSSSDWTPKYIDMIICSKD